MVQSAMTIYQGDLKSVSHISSLPSLHETFMTTAAKYGSRPALTANGVTLTYSQLARQATNLARYLQSTLGLKKGDIIAIVVHNVVQFPIAFLGAQIAGLVCLCLNPDESPSEMLRQFQDSGVKTAIVMDNELLKVRGIFNNTNIEHVIVTGHHSGLAAWRGAVPSTVAKIKEYFRPEQFVVLNLAEILKEGSNLPFEPVLLGQDDPCVLHYSKDVAINPAGVRLTQGYLFKIIGRFKATIAGATTSGSETVLVGTPLYEIFGLVGNFLTFILTGQHLVLVSKFQNIQPILQIFSEIRPSIVLANGSLFDSLISSDKFRDMAVDDIKIAFASDSVLADSLVESWKKITGCRIRHGWENIAAH
jgi:long-chain acyl-CoA synthetase